MHVYLWTHTVHTYINCVCFCAYVCFLPGWSSRFRTSRCWRRNYTPVLSWWWTRRRPRSEACRTLSASSGRLMTSKETSGRNKGPQSYSLAHLSCSFKIQERVNYILFYTSLDSWVKVASTPGHVSSHLMSTLIKQIYIGICSAHFCPRAPKRVYQATYFSCISLYFTSLYKRIW